MRALIFDCDGVLAETERDGHRAAFNRMFAAEGVDFEWTEDDYASVLSVAGGKERLRRLCTDAFVERHGLPTEQAALDELVALWHRRKTQIFLDLVAEGRMPSRAGVRRLASEARAAGWRLAVASTSAVVSVEAIAEQVLGRELLGECVIAAGDMVENKKPAPDIYLHAARLLGIDAYDAVAVEDSHVGHYTADEDLTAADIVVDGLGEPDGAAIAVYKNDTKTEIKTHVALEHVASLLGQSGAMRGAALPKVDSWK